MAGNRVTDADDVDIVYGVGQACLTEYRMNSTLDAPTLPLPDATGNPAVSGSDDIEYQTRNINGLSVKPNGDGTFKITFNNADHSDEADENLQNFSQSEAAAGREGFKRPDGTTKGGSAASSTGEVFLGVIEGSQSSRDGTKALDYVFIGQYSPTSGGTDFDDEGKNANKGAWEINTIIPKADIIYHKGTPGFSALNSSIRDFSAHTSDLTLLTGTKKIQRPHTIL